VLLSARDYCTPKQAICERAINPSLINQVPPAGLRCVQYRTVQTVLYQSVPCFALDHPELGWFAECTTTRQHSLGALVCCSMVDTVILSI
jgi:hypothetical protein